MIELASLGFGALDQKHFDLDLRCCTIVKNRQDACSTKSAFSCGVGILPAQKRLIENGARCDLGQRFGLTHPTRIFRSPNLAKS
ncbi:hypothetical protein D0A34_06380 [Microcoleus vaginatus PCC 9802]|nr:hypothetical protein D0A34_06380 [Microcoleus vaginatus PCC 9802]